MHDVAGPKKVFLVGCPRSGTTWLQILLGSHPKVVTVRETHLFDLYFRDFYARWHGEEAAENKEGLRILLNQTDLDDATRAFAEIVFRKIAGMRPDADILLEKTPAHVAHHQLINRLFPDAMFLHLLRDPRAVAASLVAAHQETWGDWASADVASAAQLWCELVSVGLRELPAYGDAHLLVRYEHLFTEPNVTLDRIWRWLGLEPLALDLARFSIAAIQVDSDLRNPLDPSWEPRRNFFRRGTPDGWKNDLSAEQISTIESICGGLLEEAGYSRSAVNDCAA